MLTKLRRQEEGVALVVVLLSTFVLFALVAATMSYAIGSQTLSRRDQDWNAALAAAEAGVDDYLFRLNEDGSYWLYNAPTYPPPYNQPPPDGNMAFTTWVPIPGPANEGSFRYDVDTSNIAVDGTVKVTSTGRVRNVTRTVETTLRRRNFLDFLYFTDIESKDPAIYQTAGAPDLYTPAQAQIRCSLRYYQGRDIAGRVDFAGDVDPPQCTEINFITIDNINGPLHSNDAIRITGSPNFNGETSTSYDGSLTGGQRWWGPGPNPDFAIPGDPKFAAPLTMPPSNASIKAETNPATGGTGCLFTGPTSITLNSNGTMDVTSPFTTSYPNPTTDNCTAGAGRPLPANGVIYVQNVPAAAPYPAGCPYSVPAIGGGPNRAHPLGYPQDGDVTTYGCRNGDVFLRGTLSGRLTIASENSIVVIGNTMYNTGVGGNDLLGLVANNYVEIYHPVRTGGTITNCQGAVVNNGCNLRLWTTGASFNSPNLNAAILSVVHSFRVQNYQYGAPLGTLNINGAIAQKYRGIVGTFTGNPPVIFTGYAKGYVYDTRLKYQSPPHFLDPVASAWGVVTWAEQKAVYPYNAP